MNNPCTPTEASSTRSLRAALRPRYPEIDRLYSDAYLEAVIDVPGRAFDYARDEKIGKALEWRRSYRVDALRRSFRCDEKSGGAFVLSTNAYNTEDANTILDGEEEMPFAPSPELVDLCLTRAFHVGVPDGDGRIVLQAIPDRFNWWKSGVEPGLQYHVLVIEHALEMISYRNSKGIATQESMVIYVDVTNIAMSPPMLALTGMSNLFQRAYPDRIHRIYIGPINLLLRCLHAIINPMLRPRSRDKIVLLKFSPSPDSIATAENSRQQQGL